jgi:hypothetical protein
VQKSPEVAPRRTECDHAPLMRLGRIRSTPLACVKHPGTQRPPTDTEVRCDALAASRSVRSLDEVLQADLHRAAVGGVGDPGRGERRWRHTPRTGPGRPCRTRTATSSGTAPIRRTAAAGSRWRWWGSGCGWTAGTASSRSCSRTPPCTTPPPPSARRRSPSVPVGRLTEPPSTPTDCAGRPCRDRLGWFALAAITPLGGRPAGGVAGRCRRSQWPRAGRDPWSAVRSGCGRVRCRWSRRRRR